MQNLITFVARVIHANATGVLVCFSRDTMVKVWTVSCSELHSFGAHTAGVTAVKILDSEASKNYCMYMH